MFNTILVAFKFSRGGMLALETGARLARDQGAGLHVFHAFDYQFKRLAPSSATIRESKAKYEKQFREEALPQLDDLNDPADIDFHCLPDDPAMGICTTAAKLQADLIILGEHHSPARMSLGRLDYVGMTVVEKAPCPILIVPFH